MKTLNFAYTPLITRLSFHMRVPSSEIAVLDSLPYVEKQYVRDEIVISRGDKVGPVVLVTSGWAARSRYTSQGQRQIINILLPGDIVTPDVFVLKSIDHEIEALSSLTVRLINKDDLQNLLRKASGLSAALWWATAQEDSIVREHVVRLGRRKAIERIAHLLLEVHRRLLIVQQADEAAMIFPLSQAEIADVLGLSVVHVNKSISKLEKAGFIRRQKRLVQLIDIAGMAELCDFDTLYLHLAQEQVAS
ncbi:Crp/Fnr family transcriptional regulator [Sulfitobacter sp. S190]|uniref:Crp/Fnr family transcriptional regulator n=1 Tax=Sulfitobacter sp. S190 TaxID=2867022 RepID=UPI0021A6595D|nr:Crp/Fnr family transcriptional regulator [Sulfitobacter sp. S190]UWR21271.1 Crp/Fnr family transcriptional regulator [Sulfitobacter sp. S190]